MEIIKKHTYEDLLTFIRENGNRENGLSIKGTAGLVGIRDTSLIRGAALKSKKLAEMLAQQGFEGAALSSRGFPAEAVAVVIEYYAMYAQKTTQQAKAWMSLFAQYGVNRIFDDAFGVKEEGISLPKNVATLNHLIQLEAAFTKAIDLVLARQDSIGQVVTEAKDEIIEGQDLIITELDTFGNKLGNLTKKLDTTYQRGVLTEKRIIDTVVEKTEEMRFKCYGDIKSLKDLLEYKDLRIAQWEREKKDSIPSNFRKENECVKDYLVLKGRGLKVLIRSTAINLYPDSYIKRPDGHYFDPIKYRRAIDHVVASNRDVERVRPTGSQRLTHIVKHNNIL